MSIASQPAAGEGVGGVPLSPKPLKTVKDRIVSLCSWSPLECRHSIRASHILVVWSWNSVITVRICWSPALMSELFGLFMSPHARFAHVLLKKPDAAASAEMVDCFSSRKCSGFCSRSGTNCSTFLGHCSVPSSIVCCVERVQPVPKSRRNCWKLGVKLGLRRIFKASDPQSPQKLCSRGIVSVLDLFPAPVGTAVRPEEAVHEPASC